MLEGLCERAKETPIVRGHDVLTSPTGHSRRTQCLVLTRPVTRNERHSYQVYRQPIPVQELVLEDLQDGDVRMGGSFRGAFGNSDKGTSPTLKWFQW